MSEETAEPQDSNPNKKRSRKKRKNFLINAKKYAKKGQMGRGAKIPEELYQYFVGILDAIKQGIDDEDERQALVNNVLERTKENELDIIGNQLGCRVIEILLPYSTAESLERYMDILSPELRPLCSDYFASHVVETVLRVACDRATLHLQTEENLAKDNLESEDEAPKKKRKKQNSESELPKPKLGLPENKYSDEHIKKCYEFTLKISKYALNNLEDFVWDQCANHILRSALKCLSGIILLPGEPPKTTLFKLPLKNSKGLPPDKYAKMVYKIVPDEFKELVKEFANRLSSWPQYKDLPYQNITSGLLQVLLYAVKNVDKHLTRDLIKKLLDESFAPEGWVNNQEDEKKDDKIDIDNENENYEGKSNDILKGNLPPVFQSESAVRLLEAALYVAKKKTYTQIYARCFINRLGQLATLPMLNYTVQRLFDNCQIKEELEPIFDELSDKFSDLLASGNTGVIVAVAKACLRVQARQAQFITKLEVALKCSEQANQKYFSICCLRLLPLDRIDASKLDKEYFINIHGSVVLQTILDFQRPAKAVQGLLELSPDELVVILSDAKGCHVADALCKGQCVGVKARDKLVWKLKGYYQKLALSQYGSRAFEQIFQASSPEQRIKIMTELSDKSNLLNSSQYGRLIASKLEVATFKLSQKNWEESWKKKNK